MKRLKLADAPGVVRAGDAKSRRSREYTSERIAGIPSGVLAGRHSADPNSQSVISLLMLLSGLCCLVVAFALLPGPLSALQVFIALGLGLTLVSIYLAFTARAGAGAAQMESVARIERRLERLQDARWELNEEEARYRALLDSQEEAILRRDEHGLLTFANKAFLDMFGLKAETALGTPFVAKLCEECAHEPLSTTSGVRRQRIVQHVLTVAGPRWIEWEEQLVAGPDGTRLEVQCVGRDVTQRKRAEMHLAEARDLAESANRAKGRFLATMSHEIRTPMNGILGMASLLSETEQTPEQQTYVRAIDQSARTLLALIDEILDFSKIEAGKLALVEAPFALNVCVQEAVELLAPRAHEKGLEIAWTVSPQLPNMVIGDEARFRQILLNLLSNAVKFTDAGGVSVRITRRGELVGSRIDIEMTVEDTGIGMSAEDMRVLFSEFEQADVAVRRREGGTGLGLTISRELARAMGGDIRVTSELGRGSVFSAALMLQRARNDSTDGEAIAGADDARVLLVFDRPLERRALGEVLDAAGVAATECGFASAVDHLRAAQREGAPFDRIVIDGAEGVAEAGKLLSNAREINKERGVRGIVLVNVLARSMLSEFRDVGFDAYLVRPVRPSSLMIQLGLQRNGAGDGARERDCAREVPVGVRAGSVQRVLLAEDNEINLLLAKRVLEKCGCEYVAVSNGAEAVAFMQRSLAGDAEAIDLVLMDIFMPHLDGMEAARAIRALYARESDTVKAPPIIALTASAFAEDRQRYLESGMDDYLAKPFDKAGLEGVLRRWFGPLPGSHTDPA